VLQAAAFRHYAEGFNRADQELYRPFVPKDYNHSTFCDLLISGLAGLRARSDGTIEVNPLARESWD